LHDTAVCFVAERYITPEATPMQMVVAKSETENAALVDDTQALVLFGNGLWSSTRCHFKMRGAAQ